MTSWTGLLESLHSALIDEITERHPEPKPELGLPSRHSQWQGPNLPTEPVLAFQVAFGAASGLALLAMEKQAEKILKLDTVGLWDAILKRAGSEFMRRKIQPRLSPPSRVASGAPLPKGFAAPTRVIWIPIRIQGASIFLGVGV